MGNNQNPNPDPILEARFLVLGIALALKNAQHAPESELAYRIAALEQAAQLSEDMLQKIKAVLAFLKQELPEPQPAGGNDGSH